MANVHFILHSRESKTDKAAGKTSRPIYLCYRFGKNDKIIYSTGFKVPIEHWNPSEYRLRKNSNNPDKDRINNFLSELETVTESFITKTKIDKKELTKQELKTFLDNYLHPAATNINSFIGYFKKFIDEAETRTNSAGQRISYKRIRGYFRTFELINEYCKYSKKETDFQDINLDFYQDFTKFLQTKTVSRNGEKSVMSTNTIGNKIQCIKAVLNDATDKGINKNMFFKSQKFKAISEENENIYLTESELEALRLFDFTKFPKLDKVRDLFLIGAWTGLRFSDFTRLHSDNIRGNRIFIEQQKTAKPVVIPCSPVFNQLWDKYDGKLPKVISNQKFNEYIKEACKLAGINEPFFKGITKGGHRITKKYEKWELVSSHTARRSFATNHFKSGLSAIAIMNITGHKTEKAFLRYIKATQEDYATLLELHWKENHSHLKAI
jgi:site-specific recombinase XerD